MLNIAFYLLILVSKTIYMDITFIDSDSIEKAADYNTWVDTIESSFNLERDIDFKMPIRTHIDFDENTLLLMPCIGSKYFATKIVSLFPKNSNRGLAPLSGLVILNSSETGQPLAILEGSTLTALRTAAVGSFGIRHLASKESSNLGVIGLGRQGVYQSLFACTQRRFKTIRVFDTIKKNIDNYRAILNTMYPDIEIITAKSIDELLAGSEVIITATNSNSPVLPDKESLLRDKTYIGIGSYKPEMREFPDTLFKMVDRIYIDTTDGLKESGDLIDPLKYRWISENNFISGTEIVKGINDANQTRVFKSVGMALFDLAAAILVYEKYISK